MTTVAFDGKTIACDTLATDAWGMKEVVKNKILSGNGFAVGCAGQTGDILRWWKCVSDMDFRRVLEFGFPDYRCEENDPALMLISKAGEIYRHATGVFVECSRGFHAVGSGRDYALAAMWLGKSAKSSVEVAMQFDNGTGGEIITLSLEDL